MEGASCGLAPLAVLPALAAHPFTARVFRVTDGDPITVEAPGYIVRVRLFDIDCPARNQDGWAAGHVVHQVRSHGPNRPGDRHGHMVAGIVIRNWCERATLVVLAIRRCDADLQALEADARERHRGLWSASNPLPPWEWRKLAKATPKTKQPRSRRSQPRSERRSDR